MIKSNSYKYPLPIGTVLKGGNLSYRITQVLGQGSYGITYKATAIVNLANISEEWAFAIKENFAKDYCSRASDGVTMTYPGEHAEEAERDLGEFIYEGNTLQKICNANSNIIDVNETFKENNTAYYVMKFIDGEDLYKYVKRKGKLDELSAIEILKPIADAVSHLHGNRRMHLDVKPENIMIRKDDTPILIDFGTVLHFNSTGLRTGTSKDRSIACSDGYAPMEQYLGIETFSPETDVYALGATLLFMLTGNEPPKASELSLKAMEASLPKNISKRTRDALVHAMQPLKEDRTATVAAFLKELTIGDMNIIGNGLSKSGESKVSTRNNKGTKKLDNKQGTTHTESPGILVPREKKQSPHNSNTFSDATNHDSLSPSGGEQEPETPRPPKPESHMAMAFISSLLCPPFGIVAIISASEVNSLYYLKDYDRAEEASANASKWAKTGICTSGVLVVFCILLMIIAVANS